MTIRYGGRVLVRHPLSHVYSSTHLPHLVPQQNEPYVSAMDLIGAPVMTSDFVVSGGVPEEIHKFISNEYMVPLLNVIQNRQHLCVHKHRHYISSSSPQYTPIPGTCTNNLHGMCESLYRPDMAPDELFETISQCLLASCDRDALSGWGAMVHVITHEGITSRRLKGRQD